MQLAQRRRQRTDNQAGRQALGQAISYLWRYPRYTAASVIALLLATAAQLAVPQLVQEVIDSIVASAVAVDLDLGLALRGLLLAAVIIVIIAIARGLFAFGQTYLSQALSQNIAFELRNDLFAKIQRLSFSYHDQNQTGQLMIRATDDVERLRVFIGQALLLALQALLLLVGTLALLFATNVRLTLVVIPILPIALIVFMIFGGVAQPLFRRIQEKLSAVNTILQENLAGLKVVKSFATERREQARFRHSIDDLLDERIVVSRTFSFLFPFIFLVANLGQAAILYFGGREIIGGSLTLGEWQKFSLYLTYLFLPMGQLGFIIALTAQAAASAQRIFEILEAENKVTDKPGAIELPAIRGEVIFDNVTFRYFASGEPVLKNVSFHARPGQTVALLGATGSGKTTIINLIPRFYDVSEGAITIDGHDVRNVTIESLRTQIGIVLQETTLFSGTIRDNIAYGRPDATLEEIENAAKAAAAHDFIMSFPMGYETAVGERGSTLSGGQRQRIAIARALLLDPQILILDDSTSSVDLQTEFLIQQALDKLMEGRTSFVIAQRISTVVNADQILILDQGEIVDRGTHEELLENSAIYAEIYYSQLAD
jgi:ATP-binding cassette, subfamily B, multidrug efflux pump